MDSPDPQISVYDHIIRYMKIEMRRPNSKCSREFIHSVSSWTATSWPPEQKNETYLICNLASLCYLLEFQWSLRYTEGCGLTLWKIFLFNLWVLDSSPQTLTASPPLTVLRLLELNSLYFYLYLSVNTRSIWMFISPSLFTFPTPSIRSSGMHSTSSFIS